MNAKDLRIVFMGTPEFAVTSLRALVEGGYNIVGVVTTPDKPAGRGRKIQQSDVKQYAVEQGLPVLQPVKLRDPEFQAELEALKPDLGIVIAFRMLPESVWSLPRLGTFNLHASLLPQYRGAAPINWAIINGESETGVTTFLLNHQIDTGDIIGQVRCPILPSDNIGTLYDKLMNIGSGLVIETVEKIAEGNIAPIVQSHIPDSELKPAPKIFKEDCLIDWTMGGEQIVNFVRGLSPYPAAWSYMYKDNVEVNSAKIFSVSFEKAAHQRNEGEVCTDGRTMLKVACKDGWISLDEVQLAGKRRMAIRDLLLGLRDAADYCFTAK
ncbi:MAG: methionyl-tRNA formyltransferase [Rikenellaceae bacterium]|nr:methionyl-tRNA formyltransferase [Rikenellaceae bacterium]